MPRPFFKKQDTSVGLARLFLRGKSASLTITNRWEAAQQTAFETTASARREKGRRGEGEKGRRREGGAKKGRTEMKDEAKRSLKKAN
jgi:hypothetical protein